MFLFNVVLRSYGKKKKRNSLSSYFADKVLKLKQEEAREWEERIKEEERLALESRLAREKRLKRRESIMSIKSSKSIVKETVVKKESKYFKYGYDLRKVSDIIKNIKSVSEVSSNLLGAALEADKLDWEREKEEFKDPVIYNSDWLSENPELWSIFLESKKKVKFKKRNVNALIKIIQREMTLPDLELNWEWTDDNIYHWNNFLYFDIGRLEDFRRRNILDDGFWYWLSMFKFSNIDVLDLGLYKEINFLNFEDRLYYYLRWVSDYNAEVDVSLYFFLGDRYLYFLGENLRLELDKFRTGISILAGLIMYMNKLCSNKDSNLNKNLLILSFNHILKVDNELDRLLREIRKNIINFRKYLFSLFYNKY